MESAPTGCFKCGRPGHWSRDCPSSAPVAGNSSSSTPALSQTPKTEYQRSFAKTGNPAAGTSIAPVPKLKKTKVQRPKLTPDLLLSEDGLGYVLRYFPKSFKYRGRGKEVSDLGNLIRLYSEWHSHLLPYYSFDQFVHKVQQVANTKRVKICINELRERVANGVDPNKLYEKPDENAAPSDDHDKLDMNQPSPDEESIPCKSMDADTNVDAFQDNMLNEIFDNAMESIPNNEVTEGQSMEKAQSISEEQRLRMEANRLKAIERAKARLRPNQH